MIQHYAVMGSPIVHSLSPMIHQCFAKQTGIDLYYEKIEVPVPAFERYVADFFKQGGTGLNITVPFKQRAFAMARLKTPRCEEAKAANTLWQINGVLHADNTDGVGLSRDLDRHIKLTDQTIVVLGAGGAARGIMGALLHSKPKALVLSNRTLEKACLLQQQFPSVQINPWDELTPSYDIIINATSSSLNQHDLSLPPSILSNEPFCYDLAYDIDTRTPFVQWAKIHNCRAADGIGMLIEQAAETFYIWHGRRPETAALLRSVRSAL